jgi:hypothetical protein
MPTFHHFSPKGSPTMLVNPWTWLAAFTGAAWLVLAMLVMALVTGLR